MRPDYERVIESLSLLAVLREFDPRVIGTPPLGLAIETSDIDVACSATDLDRFRSESLLAFGDQSGFHCRGTLAQGKEALIVQFSALDWTVELFCQSVPVDRQWGVRHFKLERRLLEICPELHQGVLQLRRNGLKTEPAFARLLGLAGDPYQALLELEGFDDETLSDWLRDRPVRKA